MRAEVVTMTRLQELRLQHGLNMTEAARIFGVPYTTYVDWDKGRSDPNALQCIQIAAYYGVSLDYLAMATDDPRTPEQKQIEEEELKEYLEMLRTRPEMRVLLDTIKGASKEEVEANVKFIEALRKR